MKENLEKRIQRLEDIESIKILKAKYCYYTDLYYEDPTNLDRLMNEVFSPEAELDFGPMLGKAKNKEEVKDFFENMVFAGLSFCQHLLHNPIIEIIDENQATGRWSFLVPCTREIDQGAGWLSGIYDEQYEKRDGKWLIKIIKVKWFFGSSHAKGWVEDNIFHQV